MIRGSLLVAFAAVLLSVLVHGLGLRFTARDLQPLPDQDGTIDVADVGSTFEDFAESVSAPEPPDVTLPEPVTETPPTSQALVASDTPQFVTTPDTGTGQGVAPDEGAPSDDAPTAPDTEILAAEGAPDGTTDPVTTETVIDTPEPAPVEATQPDIVIASLPEDPEILAPEDTETESNSAVARSLRPPKERPSAEALGVPDGTEQPRVASGVIESPLTAYRRSGVDLLSGSRSGGTGFSGSRAAGNATATNYAGQILLRLNRAPVVYASERGSARVSFQINPDGSLAWVRVLASTGTSDIVRAARAQVQSAAPFPRPPSGTSQRLVFNYRNR